MCNYMICDNFSLIPLISFGVAPAVQVSEATLDAVLGAAEMAPGTFSTSHSIPCQESLAGDTQTLSVLETSHNARNKETFQIQGLTSI